MSSAAINYDAMPTAHETERWDVSVAQLKLLASIIKKPRHYAVDSEQFHALRELSETGLIEFHNGKEGQVWRATPAGFGRLANPLPDYFAAYADQYHRARNWGRVDRLPTRSCDNCRADYTPTVGARSGCCAACVLAALATTPQPEAVEQTREGWASTAPGRTKYHHYGPDGQSKCSYQKGTGATLHFAPDPKQLTPAECCSSCDLHILKAEQASALLTPKGDGLQMRWASIGTPGPPYHFWSDNGAKVCTFEGEHRPRYFYPSEATPTPAERCHRCWDSLRNLATHRADFAAQLPAVAVEPITPAVPPPGTQYSLFL